MMATIDLALAVFPWEASLMSLSKPLARATRVAAGRACNPVGLGMTTVPTKASPPPPADARVFGAAGSIVAAKDLPPTTIPVSGRIEAIASILATTTWVRRLFASRATRSTSKVMSLSPTATLSPLATWGVNPRPSRLTVSRPTWMRISIPSGVRIVRA